MRENGDCFGYSLALGSAEVPLLHLTNAFRSLANGGRFSPLVVLPTRARPAFTPALDARAAFIVGDILSDGNARARTFGTDSVLATRFWSAVKTGTSKDMRDNWAVGWSERYTVGVWVGNASGAAMHDVSGTSGAAPVWATVMGFLHAREPSRPPRPPQGLVQWPVRFGPAGGDGDSATASLPLEAARTEWFVPGTQQSVFAINNVADGALSVSAGGQKRSKSAEPQPDLGPARILMPVHGTVIALDPDIPPQSQRLRLQAADLAAPRLAWRMDGKPLGRGAVLEWLPWPGRHTLELVDAQGLVLDTVRFEVRGAGVAPGAVPGTASKPR